MDSFPGKRQRESEFGERNGRQRKRPNQFGGDQEQVLPTPDDTTYRILCPGAKIGSIIGKGGNIIKSLRRETHARIKVTDPVPGVDERVVLIWSTPQEEERNKQKDDKEDEEEKDDSGSKKARGYSLPEDGAYLCPAQEALFKVHARIAEEERNPSDNDEEDLDEEEAPRQVPEVTARLLVPNNQIGCLLGKGGKIIEKMRTETGAQIRILRRDTLPGCALPSDELVQISGDPLIVKKAMYEISARIHESPPRDRPQGTAAFLPPPGVSPAGPMLSQSNMFPPVNPLYGPASAGGPLVGVGPPLSGYGGMDQGVPWPLSTPAFPMYPPSGMPLGDRKDKTGEQEFAIHVLCPNDKTGIVIGKGGNAIRQLRDATGARIKVAEVVPEAEERLVVISAIEHLDDRSPVIEAVLQLQGKISNYGKDNEGLITTRLLVPSRQIGCLLGKRGSVISEMRKKTNANLKVLQKTDLPKCAQETDELVQIIGDENVARQALLEVLMRLRNHVFRDQIDAYVKSAGIPMPSYNLPPMQGAFAAPPPNLGSMHELGSPGGLYSLNGLGLQGGQVASNYSATAGAPFQGSGSGYGGYSGFESSLYSGHVSGGGSGLNDGSLRNSSGNAVEVTIPGLSVGSVLGKGGSNLSSIRRISGAKLKVLEPNPISGDRVVEIYGTPEQTQAAHSLLQGFIYSGQSSGGAGSRGVY